MMTGAIGNASTTARYRESLVQYSRLRAAITPAGVAGTRSNQPRPSVCVAERGRCGASRRRATTQSHPATSATTITTPPNNRARREVISLAGAAHSMPTGVLPSTRAVATRTSSSPPVRTASTVVVAAARTITMTARAIKVTNRRAVADTATWAPTATRNCEVRMIAKVASTPATIAATAVGVPAHASPRPTASSTASTPGSPTAAEAPIVTARRRGVIGYVAKRRGSSAEPSPALSGATAIATDSADATMTSPARWAARRTSTSRARAMIATPTARPRTSTGTVRARAGPGRNAEPSRASFSRRTWSTTPALPRRRGPRRGRRSAFRGSAPRAPRQGFRRRECAPRR